MRDHARNLGRLFMLWAALSLLMGVLVGFGVIPVAELQPTLFALTTVLSVMVYGFVGWRLVQHDPRVRTSAIILSVLALLSLPIGTAIGIYGLWALFGSPKVLSTEGRGA